MPAEALEHVELSGAEPVMPSSFRVGTAAQATIAASGLAAAELWRMRGGKAQQVAVDMRHAAVEFHSEGYFRLENGEAPRIWDKIAGTYRCGDGRWVRIHTNFSHHRDGILELLGSDYSREAVEAALQDREADDFVEAASGRGLIAAMMRTPEEWAAHPQGQALANLPIFEIEKIGEASVEPLGPAERPLGGVRVLDLTRIIAGPVCGRALAAHGADVMRITAPHLPFVEVLVMDAGRGKLSAHVDLNDAAGRETLAGLLGEADVFVQGYRPGGIARHGFGPEDAARFRPGIIYVSLCAYGHGGPWQDRRGFDSIVQTASGINYDEAMAAGVEGPKPLPCQALDHASGFLMAFGTIAGLMRRAEQGGSWHVKVGLAQTGRWLQSLGRLENGLDCAMPGLDDVADLVEEVDSGFGRLSVVRHAAVLSATPARWERPSMPLGSHPPVWPE